MIFYYCSLSILRNLVISIGIYTHFTRLCEGSKAIDMYDIDDE